MQQLYLSIAAARGSISPDSEKNTLLPEKPN